MELKFEDKVILTPDSWKDIKLKDYEKWYMREPQTRAEQIQFIADVCNIDVSVLYEAPTQVFDIICNALSFVFKYDFKPSNKITINNVEHVISLSDKLVLVEWIEVEEVLKSDSQFKISDILSIVCRPVGEKYDMEVSESRKEIFKNLSCDKVLPLIAFFLFKNKQSKTISTHCSMVINQASRLVRDMKNFVLSGDGIKRLRIWQIINFTYLTFILNKRLSRFSDSYSIKPTEIEQNQTKVNTLNK